MKRLEHLIKAVRRNTNIDSNKSDFEIISYFNKAQSRIQEIVYEANTEGLHFSKTVMINLVSGVTEYELPSNCYMDNSVVSVWRDSTPLNRISLKEVDIALGYAIKDTLIIPSYNLTGTLKVVFTASLPELSKRVGTVESSTVNTIKIKESKAEFMDEADYISIVDRDGNIILSNIYVESFSAGSRNINVDVDASLASAGHYVVVGKNSTTHPQLPKACETFLLDYVERRIASSESSTDLITQSVFSSEQESALISIFSNNNQDAIHPPVTDFTFWGI